MKQLNQARRRKLGFRFGALLVSLLVLSSLLLYSWVPRKQLTIDKETLLVEVEIIPLRRLCFMLCYARLEHLNGKVRVTNKTAHPQPYGNGYLSLTIDDQPARRPYVNHVVAWPVDLALVELKPYETMELPVYWAIDDIDRRVKLTNFSIDLDEAGIENRWKKRVR